MIRLALLSLLTTAFLCSASLAMEPPSPETAYQAFREAEALPSTVPAVLETHGLPTASVQAERVVTITGLMDVASPQKQELLFLPAGGDPAMLALPTALPCITDGDAEYGGPLIYDCPVSWDTAALNTADAGRTVIMGQLSPEDGYALAPDADGQVAHPVVITAPGMPQETLESVELDGASFSLMALGGGPMEPDLNCTGAVCYAGSGIYFPITVDWDLSTVDHSVPGIYSITGTPRLPEGFVLPEGTSELTAEVGVVSSDYVDLSAPSINPEDNAYVFFSWLHQPQDRRSMVLQYSTDGSSWQDAPVDEYGVGQYGTILWNGLGLTLNLTQLEPHKPYHFRILYDDDQVSNTAELYVADTAFTMAVGGKGGDRDGGDWPTKALPDYQQPAPETSFVDPAFPPLPWVPEPVPNEDLPSKALPPPDKAGLTEHLFEFNTKDATSISRTRLHQLTGASNTVLFEKHGVAAELSSEFLSSLELSADELLTVEIRLPEPDTFTLDVRSGNESLSNLPPTIVRIPWEGPEMWLQCCRLDGTVISSADYHTESRTVSCTISAPGTYRINGTSTTASPLPPAQSEKTIPPDSVPETRPTVPQPEEDPGQSQLLSSGPEVSDLPTLEDPPETLPHLPQKNIEEKAAPPPQGDVTPLCGPISVLTALLLGAAAVLWRKLHHEG